MGIEGDKENQIVEGSDDEEVADTSDEEDVTKQPSLHDKGVGKDVKVDGKATKAATCGTCTFVPRLSHTDYFLRSQNTAKHNERTSKKPLSSTDKRNTPPPDDHNGFETSVNGALSESTTKSTNDQTKPPSSTAVDTNTLASAPNNELHLTEDSVKKLTEAHAMDLGNALGNDIVTAHSDPPAMKEKTPKNSANGALVAVGASFKAHAKPPSLSHNKKEAEKNTQDLPINSEFTAETQPTSTSNSSLRNSPSPSRSTTNVSSTGLSTPFGSTSSGESQYLTSAEGESF